MKRRITPGSILSMLCMALFLVAFISCTKDNSARTTTSDISSVGQSTIASTQPIAVAVSKASRDSVYVIGTCAHGHHADSVLFSSLPPAVADYLTANYSGYTFQKAYTDKDTSGNIAGYIVIIQYNGKPVGLKFDASGTFVRVLEQREGHDLNGRGWHDGGMFDNRNGLRKDTVALNSLSVEITSYFTTNYAQDTLIRAYRNKDGSYEVLSINNGVFATMFDATGTFVKRVALPAHPGHATSVALATLPSTSQTYLAATYPDYVFDYAFEVIYNGTVQDYIVFIDANSTKYAVEFDSSGSFIRAATIH